jgi:hypothetical protein
MIIYQFSQGRKEGVGEKKSMRNEYKRLEQKAIGDDRGGGYNSHHGCVSPYTLLCSQSKAVRVFKLRDL